MGDPSWTGETEVTVTAVIRDGAGGCCDACVARDVLTALAAKGLLVAPGGEVRTEESWSHPDGTECTEESCGPGPYRRRVVRTVTEWPDGARLTTTWREVRGG